MQDGDAQFTTDAVARPARGSAELCLDLFPIAMALVLLLFVYLRID